jgi:hypothetical protein
MNVPHPLHQIGRLAWSFVKCLGMERVPGLFDLCLILPGAIFLFPENGVIAIINDLPKEQNP